MIRWTLSWTRPRTAPTVPNAGKMEATHHRFVCLHCQLLVLNTVGVSEESLLLASFFVPKVAFIRILPAC